MIKKKFIFFLSLCSIIYGLNGQEINRISASQAVDIALKNSVELKNLKLDVDIQTLKNKEVIASAYPQISAAGGVTYYTNLPKIQFPTSNFSVYEVLEKEGVKDGNGASISRNSASFGSQAVSFVAPLNMQFGLSVNQLLFQPDLFVAYKARATVLEFANKNILIAEDKVKEAVQKAYYAVLIAQKQKEVLSATRSRLDKLLEESTQLYKNGFVEKLDIDKLQVSINNTQTAQNQLNNGINISVDLLKNTMGLNQRDSIILTDELNLANIQSELLITSIQNFDYGKRNEFSLLTTAKRLQELDMERNKLGLLPTVAAFYQLQRSGQRNEDFIVNDSPWFWFTTGLIGLSVNQPIYDGGQRKHRVNQSKLGIQKIENSIEQLKQYIDLDQSIAKNSINNAVLNLEVQDRNKNLAQSVFETTKVKYQSGLGSSFEVLQADTELQRANGSYFQALYEAYVAKVSYMKAIGNL
jgi:outer membrane protein